MAQPKEDAYTVLSPKKITQIKIYCFSHDACNASCNAFKKKRFLPKLMDQIEILEKGLISEKNTAILRRYPINNSTS